MAQHIFSGSGAPASTPTAIGQHYIDTTNGASYISVGTTSAADWESADASAAIAAHVAAVDPHTQYLTAAEGNAAYEPIGAAASAIASHVAAVDPHPGYLTPAEGNAAYDSIGSAAAAQAYAIQRANHTGTQSVTTIDGGNNNAFAGFSGAGVLESMDGWSRLTNGGENVNITLEPNNGGGGNPVHARNAVFEPLQNSPNESWNVFSHTVTLDNASSGFSMGTAGEAVALHNLYFSHQGTGDVGTLVFLKLSSNIGNGTDPIDVKGLSFAYGFSTVAANVNLSGPIQGWGFQLSTNALTTASANTYVNAFYDFATFGNPIDQYTSLSIGPTLAEIRNNANFTGINLNPTITTFSGNAGFNGIAIAGNITNMGTGGYNGIIINSTVSDSAYAYGLFVDMTNVTSSGTILAAQFNGDVSINGSLTFSGALSIGQLSAYYSTAPDPNTGGAPSTYHGLITAPVAATNTYVGSSDTIGVNTAALTTMNSGSTVLAGPLGLGVAALALPCVTQTHTNSYLSDLSTAVYALSLDVSSTGGTIDTVHGCRVVGVPNGVTTINHFRAVEFNLPFGGVATQTHGLWFDAGDYSWMSHGLKIGGVAPTAATASWTTTAAITLTDREKGTARNTNTVTLQVAAAAANPTNTILAMWSGTSAAMVLTITPNDGTNNGGTPVNLTTAELVQLFNEGSVTGKTVTVTDASFFMRKQSASGGDATNLADGGEGDGLVATFSGGAAGTDVVDSGCKLQIEGGDIKLAALDVRLDTTTGTKFGTATSQKLGFWNTTPIVQPTTAVTGATVAIGVGGNVKHDDTFDGYTIDQVVRALRNIGLLA